MHDPQGKAYAALGLAKGARAAVFIDKKGVVRLRWPPFDWRKRKATGADGPDLLDIYADIEKHLGLSKVPAGAKVATFQQGVSPKGYAGCTGLQIWPRYKKKESLASKQTAFVRGWTGGEFIIIQFQDITGAAAGRIPPGSKVHKAYLRLTTINHASTQRVTVHRMRTPWDVNATYHRSAVKDGKDVPWTAPNLGEAGANFRAEPVVKGDYQIPINYGDVQWDITPAVQQWVDGKANYGLAVLAEKGHKTPDHACFAMGPFGGNRASNRPRLIVHYGAAKKTPAEDPAAAAKASALLKTALMHRKLRQRDKAKRMLREIVAEYPNTAAAKEAAKILKGMN